ncbi:transposase for transposon Tn5 domain protein [Escherichia coli DEC2A]|nr:transposase for transposon Tn5 domain protein [Escherichia coli DEC2A]
MSLASSLAQHAGLSIVKSSQSTAQVEGAYRLIRNPSVSPQAIAEAGFTATVRACEAHPLLLALEDTTTINFSHSTASDDLGNTTTNPKTRGLLAHSVLMYAPDSALPVGLIEQQRWSRATDTYGVKHQRKERKRLVRTVLIFTESSDQLSRATDRVPGLPASPGYVQ